jgi:hypothetical protein
MRSGLSSETEHAGQPISRLVLVLGAGAVALLVASGLLLWARQSGSVFANYLVSTIAGCF